MGVRPPSLVILQRLHGQSVVDAWHCVSRNTGQSRVWAARIHIHGCDDDCVVAVDVFFIRVHVAQRVGGVVRENNETQRRRVSKIKQT